MNRSLLFRKILRVLVSASHPLTAREIAERCGSDFVTPMRVAGLVRYNNSGIIKCQRRRRGMVYFLTSPSFRK